MLITKHLKIPREYRAKLQEVTEYMMTREGGVTCDQVSLEGETMPVALNQREWDALERKRRALSELEGEAFSLEETLMTIIAYADDHREEFVARYPLRHPANYHHRRADWRRRIWRLRA